MNPTEEALNERIKELTCLYEVSSIIVNASEEQMLEVLQAIAKCVKNGFRYPSQTEILIRTSKMEVFTGILKMGETISSNIKVFNRIEGKLQARLQNPDKEFLKEEQPLLDNIALKVGNLLEKLEIQKSERSLMRQMERADRLTILGEITAGIAHEMNTPLANILGFAELLKSDLENLNLDTGDIDKIIQNSIFTREVVKKLMFFACEMPHEKKQVDIIPHIKGAIDLLDATFRKEEIKCLFTTKKNEIFVKVDIIQLTQIIFNLIMNAIYFSPKNGLVTIEVNEDKESILISVSDEGSGINKDAHEKIFEPFFTTKPTGEGSGLGLSVVHGIVSAHRGHIEAINNKGKGACFKVQIPK
ncbi:sensor histidine kinase [Euzebyella marina]|uniref:histidine kinase n=1 Tax=Euzebyella marina TaxID=1761453 RepID=A0A3G2L5E7_9FLAO|nr:MULTISPECIES: HAMP domain-containing sensor histidine kinase [Bacteroidota]AYN67505.1 sensor histidine kinase [Euzebyella marina]MBC7000493.1 HAMP domain-containing histidine kinase [Cytophaga sp. FL35]